MSAQRILHPPTNEPPGRPSGIEVHKPYIRAEVKPDDVQNTALEFLHSCNNLPPSLANFGRRLLKFLKRFLGQPATSQSSVETDVPLLVPPGHFYSPIVNPTELKRDGPPDRLLGVEFDPQAMFAFFKELTGYFGRPVFPEHQSDGARYYWNNHFFGIGDALVLSAMMQHACPARIIEVGSGFSSAVMLDTADHLGLKPNFTFVEPNPERLHQLLSKKEYAAADVFEMPVQNVDLSVFEALEAGDILFLDTTHVCKTQSDVNHELFEILPRLKSGVYIHFHDCFDNFEYPDYWLHEENRSWNELYLLRAFLMSNSDYELLLINDTIAKRFTDEVMSISPEFLINAGGALWLRKK
jgi:predicted O-methyltransferase YrrM